jgi:hypothetical protein
MPISADAQGRLSGKFTIPPGIPSGSKAVVFDGAGGSHGRAVFVGEGSLTTQTLRQVTQVTQWYYDPLAQTFAMERNVQLSGVDLWFTAKSGQVRVQIREVASGVPTRTVMVEAVLEPAQIVVGGGGHTRVLFDAPVTLSANVEYAIVILCDDADTKLSIAEMGKFDVIRQQWVSSQAYSVGVLLSSSNASAWTPHQDRDLAFRLLGAAYNPGPTVLDLGTVEVDGATDLLLRALSEVPSATCRVEYTLTLPDGSTRTVAEGQPVQLAAPVTGAIGVTVKLEGDTSNGPVLWPGTQLLSGTVGTTADYYTRSIPATGAERAVLIYDALIPSGASVTPEIQVDGGEWESLTLDGAAQVGDGYVEYRRTLALEGADAVKARLTLTGTGAARPVVRNIRLMAAI